MSVMLECQRLLTVYIYFRKAFTLVIGPYHLKPKLHRFEEKNTNLEHATTTARHIADVNAATDAVIGSDRYDVIDKHFDSMQKHGSILWRHSRRGFYVQCLHPNK